MPSLYLGKIGGDKGLYEIHALTKDLPFREYKASEISDVSLFQKLLEGRYDVLYNGRPIYCTAVSPDTEKRIEMNPHDKRPGSVHFVAVNDRSEIECALSVAVDLGQKDGGVPIGLPLENRWKPGSYPEGASLDPFRAKYLPSVYGKQRELGPWELAELYRHYKSPNGLGDFLPRLGVYIGCYHLLVREACKKGKTATWVWVFDAIASYFGLYRMAGRAVLRDLTLERHPRFHSPRKGDFHITGEDGHRTIFYEGNKISRNVRTPIPFREGKDLRFRMEDIPFLDGVVDLKRAEESVGKSPIMLSLQGHKGFTPRDWISYRIVMAIMVKRMFEQDSHPNSPFCNFINKWAFKKAGVKNWDFNHVGSIPDGAPLRTNSCG